MSIGHDIRKFLWRIGYDFSRFTPRSHPLALRKKILNSYEIDTVLDIGANSGQFAQQIRGDLGFANRIISFEPLSSAFELLRANAQGDPNWEIFNFALGDTEEEREINIAVNSFSSSLLDILPSHLKSAPESRYIGREVIEIKRLDSIFVDICKPTNRVYMKIDTQGFESKVLKGAENSLMQIDTVQMEMSLVPLYEGELLFNEMSILMSEKGYVLVAIETGFSDQDSGQVLQIDGIFHRF
jgi:FkbM family methyltransferase